jgi:AraC-like DNA-binding protein
MCVIDGRAPFELSVGGMFSNIIVLQMPRRAVLSRHPCLEECTAEPFDPDEAGTVLLRSVLLSVLESAHSMGNDQRSAALAALIQLLGVPGRHQPASVDSGWRVQAALAFIDAEFANPELRASTIAEAQGVSRRWLDEIMVTATGASLTSQIWLRRLEQAASDLLDDRFASRTVTQIAFSAGFEDAAHFTRAFKRRYHAPPREWRRARRRAPGH